ncbi:MAG: putative lipid II flippase FtsW [Acetobacter sp.]|nr:putative lipid II flippase FtsW [Bacteroides sp.]MCM1341583.1 putative lipid II flippase FtsW [Acetobacter sp.]MCM1433660.1 putative lipid II flippase FtsW [Clostridiales bacterium]
MPRRSDNFSQNSNIIKAKTKKDGNSIKHDIFISGSIDIPFLAITIALLTIGLIMLFSASYPSAYALEKHDSTIFIRKQLIFAVIGVVAMFILSKFNYKWFKLIALPLAAVTILLLIVVLFVHTEVAAESGEEFKRWIKLGPVEFQPSDVAKFTLIVVMSLYISSFYSKMKKFKYGIVFPILIMALFCGLVVLEHHLSCTILLFLIGASLMFAGGTDWRLFAFGAAVVVIAVVIVVMAPDVLSDYAGVRIKAWLDKDFSPDDKRWQTNNSLYAIGSGGLTGVKLGNSRQKYLYVSQPQNDFIFSIVCEELGFIGAALIIALFGALVCRGIKIAKNTTDRFGALLVIGIVCQVGLQVALNILVVTDTIPNTGIALPFFSYGGTSMLMLLGEMGVVLSVSRKSSQKRV